MVFELRVLPGKKFGPPRWSPRRGCAPRANIWPSRSLGILATRIQISVFNFSMDSSRNWQKLAFELKVWPKKKIGLPDPSKLVASSGWLHVRILPFSSLNFHFHISHAYIFLKYSSSCVQRRRFLTFSTIFWKVVPQKPPVTQHLHSHFLNNAQMFLVLGRDIYSKSCSKFNLEFFIPTMSRLKVNSFWDKVEKL